MLLLRPLIDSAALISSCKAFQSLGTLTGKCSGTSCLKPKSSLHQKAGIRCLLILHVCIFTTFHGFEATRGWLTNHFGDVQAESYLKRRKVIIRVERKNPSCFFVIALESVQQGAPPRSWA